MLHKVDINSHVYTPKHYTNYYAYAVVLLLHLFLGKIMNNQVENKRLLSPPNEKKNGSFGQHGWSKIFQLCAGRAADISQG